MPQLNLQPVDYGAYDYGAGNLQLNNYNPATYQNPLDQALWNGQGVGFDGGGANWLQPDGTYGDWREGGYIPQQYLGGMAAPGNGYTPRERSMVGVQPTPAQLGSNEPWRPTVPAMEVKLNKDTGFRSWPTKQGPPQDGGAGDWASGGLGQRSANSGVSGLMQGALNNLTASNADARARALADRNKAEANTGRLQKLMSDPSLGQYRNVLSRLKKNPYGTEFLNYARGQLRDSRAVALQASEQQLAQQYAAMGRPVDPQTLALLRQQVTLANNGDLRDLMVQTAGASYNADLQQGDAVRGYFNTLLGGETAYNDALYRVLANTNYETGNQDLAALVALARLGGG